MTEAPQVTDDPIEHCEPPPEFRDRRWHWLTHRPSGSLLASSWISNPDGDPGGWWDASPLGGGGASSQDRHRWGWRWHSLCPEPGVAT